VRYGMHHRRGHAGLVRPLSECSSYNTLLRVLLCRPDAFKLPLEAAGGPPNPAAAGDTTRGGGSKTVDEIDLSSTLLAKRPSVKGSRNIDSEFSVDLNTFG